MSSRTLYKTVRAKRIALLLSLITSFSVQSATFEQKDRVKDSDFNLEQDFSSFDAQEFRQKQALEQVKSNYLLVLELVKQQQYAEANAKVTTLIQQDPNQSIYYNLNALLQLVEKNQAAAEQSFLKAVELNAKNVQALTGLAKLTLDNKQLELAKQYANKVLAIKPYETKAYQVLADVAMQQQGIDAVEALLLDAYAQVKQHLNAELAILQSLGKVYLSKKQPEKLLPLATELMERNKGNTAVLSFFAEAQLVNQNESGAEKTLRQIIRQQPNDAKHLFLLARLFAKQQDQQTEALRLLDKAALNMANPALVLSYKAAVLMKQKRYQQAFAIAQQVDELNPAQSIGKILKGDVYLVENKYADALKNYQLAYEITPDIKVLDAILKILTIQNKPRDAVALLEKQLTKNKDNAVIQYRLAIAYQTTEQYDLSIKQYQALLAKQKDNVIVLNNLAWVYNQLDNPKALKLAEKAYQLAPKSGAVADTYGHILLKNGNKQQSLKVLKRAAELNPDLTETQLHLAEAYIANQDKLQAKVILQGLLDTESAEKEKARKLMENL